MTRCGYCEQYVDRATHKDAHDPKDCREPAGCGRTNLPVGYFPLKPSSGDGRRHICERCVAQGSQAKSAQRVQDHHDELVSFNARLRKHRYQWKRCSHHVSHNRGWDLLDPAGHPVSEDEARRRMDEAEWAELRESDPDW